MIDQKDPKSVGYTHARLLQTVVKKLIEQNRFKQVTIRNTCSWLHHSCHHLTLLALRFHLPTCGHHDSLSLAKPIAVPSTPQISCTDLLACGRTSRKSKWIVSDTLPDTNTHRTFRHRERVLICTNAFWLQYIYIYASFHIKKCRYMKMLSLHFQLMPTASLPGVHMIATHTHTHTHTPLRAFYTQIDDDGDDDDDDDDDDDQWWSMMINDDQWWSMMTIMMMSMVVMTQTWRAVLIQIQAAAPRFVMVGESANCKDPHGASPWNANLSSLLVYINSNLRIQRSVELCGTPRCFPIWTCA